MRGYVWFGGGAKVLNVVWKKSKNYMITTTIKLHCLPQKRKEIMQTIKQLRSKILQDDGCNHAEFYRDLHNDDVLYLVEEWQSVNVLEKHRKSKSYAVLFGLQALLVEPLEINHAIKCEFENQALMSG